MHKVNSKLKIVAIVFITLFLQQCKLYKDPEGTNELAKESLESSIDIPEYWDTAADTSAVVENWYLNFKDPHLTKLVQEVIDTTNLNILYQLAVIDQGIAQRHLRGTGRNVQVNYGVDYLGSSSTQGNHDYGIGGSAGISWEADLWGKIQTGILSADEELQSKIYNYSYTRQSLAALVSNLYFEIGTLNNVLKVGDEFLKLNMSIAEIMKVREQVGYTNMKDVHLINAQVNAIKSIIERNKNKLQLNTRELEVLLGRYPSNTLTIDWASKDLDLVTNISNPMALINRRPDIKMKESEVRSKFYLTENAILAKYPSLVLSANIGISTISDLVFGTAGSLFGPIFNGGAIDDKIAIATAIQKQVLTSYGLSILEAFNEVESSMSAEQFLEEQKKFLKIAVEESEKAYILVEKQYEVGQIDLFQLLQIQMEWLQRKLDLEILNGGVYKQRVQLYLALGGNITNNN